VLVLSEKAATWLGNPHRSGVSWAACLVRYEEEEPRTGSKKRHAAVVFCTDTAVSVTQVLAWFVGRWNIAVTFAETRAHLRFETQRQWSPRAIGRTTPSL